MLKEPYYEEAQRQLWCPPELESLLSKAPDYAESTSTAAKKHPRSYDGTVGPMLDSGAWLDTYIAFYAHWESVRVNQHYSVFIRRMRVWDLKTKYVIGLALDGSSTPDGAAFTGAAFRSVMRHWWGYFDMEKSTVFHLLRKARRHWKANSDAILAGKPPAYFGAKDRGHVSQFHVNMANDQLDRANAEYRLHHQKGTALAYITPLGIDYLVNQHPFTQLDCLSPVFLGHRTVTRARIIYASPLSAKAKNQMSRNDSLAHYAYRQYDAVIYLELL